MLKMRGALFAALGGLMAAAPNLDFVDRNAEPRTGLLDIWPMLGAKSPRPNYGMTVASAHRGDKSMRQYLTRYPQVFSMKLGKKRNSLKKRGR
jgi:hypothetical protein